MAAVLYSNTTPGHFAPDASTPEGLYMNNLNRLTMIVGGNVAEVQAGGSMTVTDIATYSGQIRELTGNDQFTITG